MVLSPIAAAAAPTVLASAANDEGLINKLFKIGVLIGILVLGLISITILSIVIDIGGVFADTGSTLKTAASNITQAFDYALFVFTFGLSAFGFGGRK